MDSCPTPPPAPVRSAFYQHLAAAGPMSRRNKELIRLAARTGLSVEHLFRVALGREPSLAAATSIHEAVKRRNKAVTVASFFPPVL